jgi:hypothetical protein
LEDEATFGAVGLFGGYIVGFGHRRPSGQLLGEPLEDIRDRHRFPTFRP